MAKNRVGVVENNDGQQRCAGGQGGYCSAKVMSNSSPGCVQRGAWRAAAGPGPGQASGPDQARRAAARPCASDLLAGDGDPQRVAEEEPRSQQVKAIQASGVGAARDAQPAAHLRGGGGRRVGPSAQTTRAWGARLRPAAPPPRGRARAPAPQACRNASPWHAKASRERQKE